MFRTSSSALDKLFSHKTTPPPSTAPKYCNEVGTREGCFLTQRLLHRFLRVSLLAKRICSQLSLHLSQHSCLSNRCNGAITLFKCNQGRFLPGLPQCCACTHTHTETRTLKQKCWSFSRGIQKPAPVHPVAKIWKALTNMVEKEADGLHQPISAHTEILCGPTHTGICISFKRKSKK